MYEYRAFVTDVYDGDTITVDIDLGFRVHMQGIKVRLLGIDAPELRGSTLEKGRESRNRLKEMILSKNVLLKTVKDKKGKYGRWLATIYLNGQDINQRMIQEGFAKEY